ncbi:MAG: CD225/dispanin family protein [Victivallales bacterium]|nr:CD225/dispanin family protein [Victivallales bacterium]
MRKPYQPQPQQPPMAQPLNMAQVPPMADPPIKEQPVYQPFTPPSPQPPNSDGSFSTGMVWAILVLILCCNPIVIASIVLSAIAGGEFKRDDIENAQKHAKISKIITLIAAILSILSGIAVSMVPTDDSPDTNDSMILQEETDQQLSDIEKEKIIEAIENEMQKESNNGLKMDIHANAVPNGQPKKDSTDDDIRSDAFIKLYEISKQNQQNNNIQPISGNNRQSINESFKKDLINDEIWREALKKLSARSKQYNHNNVARTGNNRQQINVLQRDLIQRDKELWERIRLRIAELQKEEQQDPLRKQIKELNQKEQ